MTYESQLATHVKNLAPVSAFIALYQKYFDGAFPDHYLLDQYQEQCLEQNKNDLADEYGFSYSY